MTRMVGLKGQYQKGMKLNPSRLSSRNAEGYRNLSLTTLDYKETSLPGGRGSNRDRGEFTESWKKMKMTENRKRERQNETVKRKGIWKRAYQPRKVDEIKKKNRVLNWWQTY